MDKDEEEEKVHFKIEGITHPLLSLRGCHNYFLISAGRTVVDMISIRKERLATDYKDPVYLTTQQAVPLFKNRSESEGRSVCNTKLLCFVKQVGA